MRLAALFLFVLLVGCRRDAPLTVGAYVRGSLTQHDEPVGDGSLVDRYSVEIPAGARVTIFAESENFDAFLAATPSTPSEAERPLWTGGQSGDSPACIAFESPRDLTISLGVSSSYGLALGTYRLRVTARDSLLLGCRVNRPDAEDSPCTGVRASTGDAVHGASTVPMA